jgi:tRNA threonylcarbamoyladenosine biosynthesis protein TsaB
VSRLLLIDTAGSAGTVALAEGARVIATAELPGRSASERLVAEVRGLMEAEGWRLKELAAVVVVHGPGSFTGVRVGLSAAKGLCEAGGVAMIAVSRLAVLAGREGHVRAVLDAGRGEFFYGEYEGGRCVREALLTGDEVRAVVGSRAVVACEEKVAEGLAGVDVVMVAEPKAESALGIALERLARGAVDDVAAVDANYLRRTDFEIKAKLEARAAGIDSGGGD